MATKFGMLHPETRLRRDGFYGFSWTTFFFGPFPALFRGDLVVFAIYLISYIILSVISFGILGLVSSIIWAFIYNKFYSKNLIEKGYRIDPPNETASRELGVSSLPN